MAIGFNDAIPSSNLSLEDIYICYNKALPSSSIDIRSLTNSYNTYFLVDKNPEFASFKGIRVYLMDFPAFASPPNQAFYSDSVAISFLGGMGPINIDLATEVNVATGSLVEVTGDAWFEENGSPICFSSASESFPSDSQTDSVSINPVLETLTANFSWSFFGAPDPANYVDFNFIINMPSSTSSIIYRPASISRSANGFYDI